MLLEKSTIPTVVSLLENCLKEVPQKEAIYDNSNNHRLTYEDLDKESDAVAAELLEMGITKGDHIAVSLPNWHEFVVIYFAIAKIGAVMVPFNTKYQEAEIEYILINAKVKAAFFTDNVEDNPLGDYFEKVYQKSTYLKHLISVRSDHEGARNYEELRTEGQKRAASFPEVDAEDIFIIMYTSGTTGKPKGAMLRHRNVVKGADITASFMESSSDDVYLVAVPVFHIFGIVPCILCSVLSKAKMVLVEKYGAETVLQLVEQEKITIHNGVPTMFILELNHPNLSSYDLSSLRTGIAAAAPVPEEVVKRIRDEMKCEVLISYGMTEASPSLTATSFTDSDELRAETVGRALPSVELKIVDQETGEPVEAGEVGEIVAKSPGIMKGYYEMPEKTKEVLSEDGWYATGDLGTMDENGYVRMVGRKKDLIIRGGYNIYPREVEEHFYKHEDVVEVAIVGLPDTVLGEVSCASIKLKEGAKTTIDELKKFIKGKVAYYKVPDKIVIVPKLPMTASGKISRLMLREQMEEQLKEELR